jgi:hypothetical protein
LRKVCYVQLVVCLLRVEFTAAPGMDFIQNRPVFVVG